MDVLERLAAALGMPVPDLRLALAYYGWLVAPVVVGFVLVALVIVKVLPRQRRREDLSGQERRER